MTGLADWQAEIGGRLFGAEPPAPGGGGTPAERAGWPVTIELYRQWRLFRIRSLTPLTLARLGPTAALTMDAYLTTNPGSSCYAVADATAFLRFAAACQPEDHYLEEISFLEQALIRAWRPASAERAPLPGYLGRGGRASLRVVPFPARPLMLWLTGRNPVPCAVPGGTAVLVAPGVDGWIRPATRAEAELWHWLAMDRPSRLAGYTRAEPVDTLRQAGALC